jgi:DNA-binding response OmpR family regulator
VNQENQKMPTKRVLVVDDEKTTRMALCEALTQLGYVANHVGSGSEALIKMREAPYHVAILDLEMPGTKGTEVLATSKDITPQTDFIVLTGHASTDTAIAALRSGAVDYLRKPSSLQQIISAVERAVTKQETKIRQEQAMRLLEQAVQTLQSDTLSMPDNQKPAFGRFLEAAGIRINVHQQTAVYQKELLHLTPIEYKLLCEFVRRPNTILTYSELVLVSHETEMEEIDARDLLRTQIHRLSRKLGDKDKSPIQTMRGRGVMLKSQI